MTNRQNSGGAGVIFQFDSGGYYYGRGCYYCRGCYYDRGCYYGRGCYYDLIPTPKRAIEECQMPIIQ